MVADQGGNPHAVVHVGMGDENRIDRLDDPFGQVGDLAAIEKQRPSQGADAQEEQRIVQQAAEEGRLQVAEGYYSPAYVLSQEH
jgi:hypothetical protein